MALEMNFWYQNNSLIALLILEKYTPLNFTTHIFSLISELDFKIKVAHIYFLAGKCLLFEMITN